MVWASFENVGVPHDYRRVLMDWVKVKDDGGGYATISE